MNMQINAVGDACPLPVVKAKKALKEMDAGTLEICVDNQIAVQNLERLAKASACAFSFTQDAAEHFTATLVKTADAPQAACACGSEGNTVVVVASNRMGEGDEALGQILIKGFFFALTQLETLPQAILFYNSGAYLTTEDSPALGDIQALERAGVEILTCGTCLKHYGLADKLKAGGATNMYAIVEKQMQAGRILRP